MDKARERNDEGQRSSAYSSITRYKVLPASQAIYLKNNTGTLCEQHANISAV